ncbi:hypothetical protein CFC21_091752 [Triticum aestivum]|nr:uncharacterized protein LOC109731627 [Aegilops tauschii subsp. strangulata]XP_044418681.1 uncharacterized protein LOC123143765 [Triticum aestivum]KAF7088671.1 hypothetical protein CFC21_091752 [Triticum aestivum]
MLRHRRPRRRHPSPLALSPYRTRGREGGPKSKRAAASGSRSRGAPNPHLPLPLGSSVSPYPSAPATPSRTGGATAPQHARAGRARGSMAKLYVQAVPPPDLNKNTEWFMYLGVWTTYIFILFVSWLLILSIFGCTPGMAWTLVNLGHFAITYHFFHWKKGTPSARESVKKSNDQILAFNKV